MSAADTVDQVKKTRGRPKKEDPATPMGQHIAEQAKLAREAKDKNPVVETFYEVNGHKVSVCKRKKSGSLFRTFIGSLNDKETGEKLRIAVKNWEAEGKLKVKFQRCDIGLFATTSSLSVKMVGTVFDTATTSLASTCIYDAENEIRKRLALRYDFTASPFLTTTSIPPMISTLAETLAVGYMYENMARGSKEGYARADRYIKRAMENLTALAAGEAALVGVSGTVIDVIEGDWAIRATTDYAPTFNEDDPHSWAVSSTKLDDISDERDS